MISNRKLLFVLAAAGGVAIALAGPAAAVDNPTPFPSVVAQPNSDPMPVPASVVRPQADPIPTPADVSPTG
jgi:hypothetical protein